MSQQEVRFEAPPPKPHFWSRTATSPVTIWAIEVRHIADLHVTRPLSGEPALYIGGPESSASFYSRYAEDVAHTIRSRTTLEHQVPEAGIRGKHRPAVDAKEIANAFRTRIQSVADYQNAVPGPTWAPYVIAVGAATFGGGSAILAATHGSTQLDWISVAVTWAFGGFLTGWGILELRRSDILRASKYDEGLFLFRKWARTENEPYIGGGELTYSRAELNMGVDETRRLMSRRDSKPDPSVGDDEEPRADSLQLQE